MTQPDQTTPSSAEAERVTEEEKRLTREIQAALAPSDGDKEDIITLVKRREREAVARAAAVSTSTLSRLVEELEARADDAAELRDKALQPVPQPQGPPLADTTGAAIHQEAAATYREAASLISQSLPTPQEDE